jgi:hypothetical protein
MTTHKDPMGEDNALERGLHVLERIDDPELATAYRQYMERIESLVGREQVDTFAALYQRSQRQLSHQELGSPISPEEQAVREKVLADPEVDRLYARYMALLSEHGLMDPALERDAAGEQPAD